MWWFFRKKEDTKWKELHGSLKKSFLNIKKDMQKIKDSIEEHDNHIINIKDQLAGLRVQTSEDINNNDLDLEVVEGKIEEGLTNLQKSLLLQLKILSTESAQEWITMKYLTQELYPQKDYNDVKSMISNYTDALLHLGLVRKKRKGRQIHLSLTPKAEEILPKRVNIIKKKTK